MIVRLVGALAALALLAGCSTEEGLRAQELLRQAEVAQAQLRFSTFDGSMSVSADGTSMRVLFKGATSGRDVWFSMRTSGVPAGGDLAMQVLVRGGRSWTNAGRGWQRGPAPPAGGSGATMSAEAFQQLARHVKDVRVSEHQPIGRKLVTTIAGEIDTQGMLEAFAKLGSFAPSGFDLSDAGIELGDIESVLTIDERTGLLDTAFVRFAMSVEAKRVAIELRYRLASANRPVELPSP
jgi:hypothetical protein